MINVKFPKFHKPGIVREQQGFTLIEILVVEVLIGIIVIALAVTLANAYKLTAFMAYRETAKNFAEYEMQYLKSSAVGFNSVLTGSNGSTTYTLASAPSVFNKYNAAIAQVQNLQTNEQQIEVIVTGNRITYKLDGYKVTY